MWARGQIHDLGISILYGVAPQNSGQRTEDPHRCRQVASSSVLIKSNPKLPWLTVGITVVQRTKHGIYARSCAATAGSEAETGGQPMLRRGLVAQSLHVRLYIAAEIYLGG